MSILVFNQFYSELSETAPESLHQYPQPHPTHPTPYTHLYSAMPDIFSDLRFAWYVLLPSPLEQTKKIQKQLKPT